MIETNATVYALLRSGQTSAAFETIMNHLQSEFKHLFMSNCFLYLLVQKQQNLPT